MMTNLKLPLIQLAFCILVTAGVASGQNQDFALPLGIIAPQYSISGPAARITESAGVAFELNYGHQLAGAKWGDLYLEVPLILAVRNNNVVAPGSVFENSSAMGAVVPGPRLRFPSLGRASFFVAAGAGIGWYAKNTVFVGSGQSTVSGQTAATAAFDFGGGIDLRLTHLLSLRGEVRDLITSQGTLNGVGHHNPIIAFGPAFHF